MSDSKLGENEAAAVAVFKYIEPKLDHLDDRHVDWLYRQYLISKGFYDGWHSPSRVETNKFCKWVVIAPIDYNWNDGWLDDKKKPLEGCSGDPDNCEYPGGCLTECFDADVEKCEHGRGMKNYCQPCGRINGSE